MLIPSLRRSKGSEVPSPTLVLEQSN